MTFPCLSEAGVTASIGSALDQCLTYEESDGSPSSQACEKLLVSNGSLTDNGNGTFTLGTVGTSLTVTNLTASGTVTGAIVDISSADIRFLALNCTGLTNGGKLTTDGRGVVHCDPDVSSSGGGSGTVTSITQGTNMSFSVTPITTTGTINLTASPSVTNLTASGTVSGAIVDVSTADVRLAGLTASTYLKLDANKAVVSRAVPIPVTDGGSGATTFTSNGVLYGATTNPVLVTSQGATNSVLTASAGAPSFSATPTVTNVTATSTVTGAVVDISTADVRLSGLTANGVALTDGKSVLYATPNPYVNSIRAGSTVTGAIVDIATKDIRFSALNCTALANGGVLTALSNGNVVCQADDSGSSSGVTSISQGTNMNFSVDPIITTGTINLVASPSVTNLTASGTVSGAIVDVTSADVRLAGLAASGVVLTDGKSVLYATPNPYVTSIRAGSTVTGAIVDITSADVRLRGVAASGVLLTDGRSVVYSTPSPYVTNLRAGSTVTGAIVDVTSADVRLGGLAASGVILTDGRSVLYSTPSPFVTNIRAGSTVTGAIVDIASKDVRLNAFNCSTFANGGVLTALSNGQLVCQADDIGSGDGGITGLTADSGGATTGTSVTLAGGTDGIDTSRSVDTITLAFDPTEFNAATFGSGTFTTLTFDAGTCDPRLTTATKTLSLACVNGTNNESLTLDFDTTANKIDFSTTTGVTDLTFTSMSLDLQAAVPTLKLTDTTASQDDFELLADAKVLYLTNVTTGNIIFRTNPNQTDGLVIPTSLTIPVGGAPSMTTAGNLAEDTTDEQLLFGSTPNVLPSTFKASFHADNLVDADDNILIWTAQKAVTVTQVACVSAGFTTQPIILLEDDSGNAMTHAVLTCSATTPTTFINVTAANALVAGESLRFDNTQTSTAPLTGTSVVITFTYTVTRS